MGWMETKKIPMLTTCEHLTTQEGCTITELAVLGFKILCIDKITLYSLHLGLITLNDVRRPCLLGFQALLYY